MKKVISMVLALTLVLSMGLVGCGRQETANAETANAETSNGETATEETTEEVTTETAGEKTVVGVALPWLGTQNWAEADEMFRAE